MDLPIKHIALAKHGLNKGSLIEELSNSDFNKILEEYENLEYPSGIPEYWTRIRDGFQLIPSPKNSKEFEKSGYQLVIIRETKQ